MTLRIKGTRWAIWLVLLLLSFATYSQSMLHSLGWVSTFTPVEETFRYPQLTEFVYSTHHHQLIWLQPTDRVLLEQLLQMVVQAKLSPFFATRLQQLQQFKLNEQYYRYDLTATDTLLAFVSYRELLRENKTTWLYGHGLPKVWAQPSLQTVDDFNKAIAQEQLSEYLHQLGANSPAYQQYQKAIQQLTHDALRSTPLLQHKNLIRVGETLPDKETLFTRLEMAGLSVPFAIKKQDWYGQELKKVVQQFQIQHGLKADGVIGPETMQWLNYPLQERIRRLALNAERSILWPQQRQAIVLVNLPSFDLSYYYKGNRAFYSKVIVGKQARKTPLLDIKMDSLVLNPTWNVPPKIMREDIIPILRYNPNYLTNKGIQVIKGWSNPVVIDHGAIQWHRVNPKTFPFRMRQLSGNYNALGTYKFNTPNKRAIYLHDTPAKYLFDKPSRAFSSGCIRVQHADKFAHTLAKTQGFRSNNISPNGQGSNARVPLKRRLPVHLIYKTSWIESGRIFFRDDIYGYDYNPTVQDLAMQESQQAF
ncbi:L,D-transpeptidase family protein [Vibrio rarus]|uniref:L,D-transpeptidase family protein n=1 Tax=Vibrio rarus TaxID=413403 RepID=UPI0021C31D1E|nr:L,D-transpeptidase family protein [Vibrio rarus]